MSLNRLTHIPLPSSFYRATMSLVVAAVLTCDKATAAIQPPNTSRTIYVATNGDDSQPGDFYKPVRTLHRAQEIVRTANQPMKGNVVVFLNNGTFRLTEPLALDERDSGNNGFSVIYAAPDTSAHPVISGGVQVTGWKLVDAGKNLWAAPAPEGLKNTRQLYVDGVRAYRARGKLPVTLTETDTGYTASSDAMAKWRNPSDIEFVYCGGDSIWSEHSVALGPWTEPRCPVAAINGTTITMAQPCWDNSTKRVMLPPTILFKRTANLVGPASIGKHPSYVENAFELLGTPGQWYFDRTEKKIYYVPRPGEDLTKADVEVPIVETLITAHGTTEKPIHDITFAGIQFAYATWLMPSSSEGFSEIQANYMVTGPEGYKKQGLCKFAPDGTCPFGVWTKTPGNVSFSHARNIKFHRDAFVHLGAAGLELGNGCQSNVVEGCVFTDISANGLELGGVDMPMASGGDATSDNRIANNHSYNIAAEYHGGVAICVGYAQRSLIQYNQIDHIPYTAISLGWGGWPDKIEQAGVANTSQNNMVANNLIFNHLMLLADGGGIYTQGLTGPSLADGEKLTENVIHDQFGSGHGLYTDNGCKNVTMKRNVIFRTNHDNWGSRHKDYYDGQNGSLYDAFDGEDNYWQQGDSDKTDKSVTLAHNHLISELAQAPKAILDGAGLRQEFRDILGQQFCEPSAPEPPARIAAAMGDGVAFISWNPPVFDGGAAIDSYTVKSSKGDEATISAADFWKLGYAEVKLADFNAETAYTFTVAAKNANGSSSPSLLSETVTHGKKKIGPPSAPQTVSVNPGDGMASVHFGPPESNGNSPVTAYAVTINPSGRKVMLTGRTLLVLGGKHKAFGVIDGLENGKRYSLTVAAVNAAGESQGATTKEFTPRKAGE